MKAIKNEKSLNLLMRVGTSDEHYYECKMCLYELDEKTMRKWMELKNILNELKGLHGVHTFMVNDSPKWIMDLPEEVEDLFDEVFEKDFVEVSGLSQEFMEDCDNEIRAEGEYAEIHGWGVNFVCNDKYVGTVMNSVSIPWHYIEKRLKELD